MAKSHSKKSKIPVPFIAAAVYFVLAVVFFFISFKLLSIPIATVGIFLVLECLLAALLNRIPLWIHGLVFVGEIVAGAFFGKLVFMILMALLYAGAVALLFMFTRDYE